MRLVVVFLLTLAVGCGNEDEVELTARAGSDLTVDERDEVTLTGASTGGDRFEWRQDSGPIVELTTSGLQTSFAAPEVTEPRELVFVFTAIRRNERVSDAVTVTVEPVNDPPVADAGDDQQVDELGEVTLSGTGSDPDATTSVLGFDWDQLSGPTVELTGASADTATFTAPAVDADTELTFQLTVTDAEGLVDADVTTVTVRRVNDAPTADAGGDQSVDEQTTVTLTGAGADTDGTIDTYAWSQLSGPAITFADDTAASTTFSAPTLTVAADVVVRLTVTDNEGASASDDLTVAVNPVNASPTADAGTSRDELERDVVVLAGSGEDTDGTIVSYAWTQIAGSPTVTLTDADTATASFTAPETDASVVLELQLEVTDNEGATATATVVVTVLDTNDPPIADAGADQSVAEQVVVTLSGSGSDSDGTVVSYLWTQVSGPAVVIDAPSAATTTFSSPIVPISEDLVFRLTVYDELGASGSDDVTVTVTSPFTNPIALNSYLDFESDDGGFLNPGTLWQYGTPTTGPNAAYSGDNAWATNLSGNYTNSAFEPLYLPPLDLTTATNATLALRLWTLPWGGGDGFNVEIYEYGGVGWVPLEADTPVYDTTAGGVGVWGHQRYRDQYVLGMLSLAGYEGRMVRVRIVFRSSPTLADVGSYFDDLALFDETADPDDDGIPGVLDEYHTWLTDPFIADTDGDGVIDGDEGTTLPDRTDPAVYDGAPVLAPDAYLDFELDDGGLATDRTLWQHGEVTSGPGAGWSGLDAWATNLAGDYFNEAREAVYLPLIDLTTASNPTLSFRLWTVPWGGGDGVSVEVYEEGVGWMPQTPQVTPYESTDAIGHPAWVQQRYRSEYVLAALPLSAYVGQQIRARIIFRSTATLTAAGTYIDDVALTEETSDPDGDGIAGVIAEVSGYGTDPFIADTDGDGTHDGDEASGGTDPLDPAWYPGVALLGPGTYLDFEGDDGGLATGNILGFAGSLWEHGTVTSGPNAGWSGTEAWATNLAGSYFNAAREYLYLPPIDLTSTTSPTISARLWMNPWGGGDGVLLQVFDPTDGWIALSDVTPPYEGAAVGWPAWSLQRYVDRYVFVGASLAAYAGTVARVRFVFRSTDTLEAAGAYLDDVAIFDEGTDADDDGIAGVLDEYLVYGTDPFVPDTDGDGALDGDEVVAGTDPLDPADYPAGPLLAPPTLLDFEADDGGLATVNRLSEPGTLWQHGAPTSGPAAAHSGANVWATNLTGPYFNGAREYLHLPPIDLAAATDPTLSLRVWMRPWGGGDGVSVEFYDADAGWTALTPGALPYTGNDDGGFPSWTTAGTGSVYDFAAISLAGFVSDAVRLRLAFRSTATLESAGAYIDDIGVHEEADDPDDDGLPGVLDEYLTYGTDPFLPDTDGDGVIDGDEVGAGTDPLDPGSF